MAIAAFAAAPSASADPLDCAVATDSECYGTCHPDCGPPEQPCHPMCAMGADVGEVGTSDNGFDPLTLPCEPDCHPPPSPCRPMCLDDLGIGLDGLSAEEAPREVLVMFGWECPPDEPCTPPQSPCRPMCLDLGGYRPLLP